MRTDILRRLVIVLSVASLPLPSLAQFQGQRKLTDREQKSVMAALMREPAMSMSEDPSCKADLSIPGHVSIAQAMGAALARAAAESKPVAVRIDCFARADYPKTAGQEYCRVGFVGGKKTRDAGFGLVFLMDWDKHTIVSGSAECY